MIQQAKEFEGELDKEKVNVEVLNQEVDEEESRNRRRSSAVYRFGKEDSSKHNG